MIKKYTGYVDFGRWQRRLNQLLDEMSRLGPDLTLWPEGTWHPPVDIFENRNEVVVVVEVPGVKRSDISLSLSHNALVIAGRKEEERPAESQARFLCLERSYGEFRRVVTLATAVDPAHGEARLENGILTVHLKKISDARKAEHPIQIHDPSQ
ncbi:MAG: Hsp20/alpha crystallin family protein [Acidobacteriia bacterium]|nr:Hsp20/alpha crystallin family protein [Terriglobia bacterium]